MAYVCESCKALAKHKYWHEVPPRKFRFFKIMLGGFENQLRIPRKFIDCFRGDLSRSCVLRGQSGNSWEVHIIKTEEDVLFSEGWENFVNDHNLKFGYFLVFCYVGDFSFDVSVFDPTGCENERSHFTKNLNQVPYDTSCNSLLHLENDEGSKIAGFSAASKGKRKVDQMSETVDRIGRVTSQEKQSKMYYISKRRKVTEQEKQDANNMASLHIISKSISVREQIFKLIMLPTHVSSDFHLPHDIILRVPRVEKSWRVGCRWIRLQCQIRSGWSKFVLENNLEEHDVCVFELEKKGKMGNKGNPVFDVYIFRVVKEVVPLIVTRRL
ncbi:hypothetical protein RDABS01_020030, partial [Bienertia sinuspersici]